MKILPLNLLVVFCTACLLRSVAAESAIVVDVWSGPPPGEPMKVGPEVDITKPTDRLIAGQRIIKLGNVAQPQLHVFLPPAARRNGTAVLVCPGGGFNILAWDLEGTEVAGWLNSLGVAAVVLKYRVPTNTRDPKWLAPVQDAQRSISVVRSRAAEWGIAPDRIGALGFSAGGCVAGHVALAPAERRYPLGDAVDRVSCRPDFAVLLYPAYLVDDKSLQLKSEFVVNKEAPPMFFVHAADDRIRAENSVQLFLALRRVDVSAELHVYEKGGHGYGLRPVADVPVTMWSDRCGAWLRGRGLLAAAPRG
jgi:acetyl esterase/lipase